LYVCCQFLISGKLFQQSNSSGKGIKLGQYQIIKWKTCGNKRIEKVGLLYMLVALYKKEEELINHAYVITNHKTSLFCFYLLMDLLCMLVSLYQKIIIRMDWSCLWHSKPQN